MTISFYRFSWKRNDRVSGGSAQEAIELSPPGSGLSGGDGLDDERHDHGGSQGDGRSLGGDGEEPSMAMPRSLVLPRPAPQKGDLEVVRIPLHAKEPDIGSSQDPHFGPVIVMWTDVITGSPIDPSICINTL